MGKAQVVALLHEAAAAMASLAPPKPVRRSDAPTDPGRRPHHHNRLNRVRAAEPAPLRFGRSEDVPAKVGLS